MASQVSHAGFVQLDLARNIRELSVSAWGEGQAANLVGRHPTLVSALDRLLRFAQSESAVLLTGETGTGKELFARALFLLASHHRKRFLRVNCAQYASEQMIASELFGHRKGSFTGAISDHRGVFEEADGGTDFLDEVGDLPPAAQAMLLRVLGEGEIVPVGGTHPKLVNVRVIAATSRELLPLIQTGEFRADLYYRLRQLRVHIPPLRDRGDDWQTIADYYLWRLGQKTAVKKRLSTDSLSALRSYPWPGNVREVRSCMETGFHLCEGNLITLDDFGEALETGAREAEFQRVPFMAADDYFDRMVRGGESFWEVVHAPFLSRDLNRAQVRKVIEQGLMVSRGNYKRVITLFGISDGDYLKFMDFLRHHRLKPAR